MVRVAVDADTSRLVAQRAAQRVREYGRKHEWKSTEGIEPISEEGLAGLRTPTRHLIYQEKGIRSFLMTSLEGKTIRMKDGRYVTVRGVGQPGYVTLPGGITKWRDQKWRHPGLKPKNFMRDSVNQAIQDSMPEIRASVRKRMMAGGVTKNGGL